MIEDMTFNYAKRDVPIVADMRRKMSAHAVNQGELRRNVENHPKYAYAIHSLRVTTKALTEAQAYMANIWDTEAEKLAAL